MHAFGWLIIALFVIAGALGWAGHCVETEKTSSADEQVGSAVFYLAALLVGALAIVLLIGWALVRLMFY